MSKTIYGPPQKPDNVLRIAPKPKPPSPVAVGEDADLVELISRWKMHRLKGQLARVEQDRKQWFGDGIADAEINAALAAEDDCERLEGQIINYAPNTWVATWELLDMAMMILAEREIDEHSRYSVGPVLSLLRAARKQINNAGMDSD